MKGLLCILLLLFSTQTVFAESRKNDASNSEAPSIIKPNALKPGDTVALIAPGHITTPSQLQFAIERIEALGLKAVYNPQVLEQDGSYAGPAKHRAEQINQAFGNPDIKAIFAIRGGSGSSSLIKLIDYELIKNNPKIILGYSDVSALLIAIQNQTDLITFHGPTIGQKWPPMTTNYVKQILFEGRKNVMLKNPIEDYASEDIIQTKNRITTINPGKASGEIIGGNLSVLVNLIGSDYFPKNWKGKILFLEDTNEYMYRIEGMLQQLKNAGVLDQISGFIFGTCEECTAMPPSHNLNKILQKHITDIPAFSGALIGHQNKTFTIPVGAKVEMDADSGTIQILESSVIAKKS